MIAVSTRSLLDYAICFFGDIDYNLTALETTEMTVPAVRCDESPLSCQHWWQSEGRMIGSLLRQKSQLKSFSHLLRKIRYRHVWVTFPSSSMGR